MVWKAAEKVAKVRNNQASISLSGWTTKLGHSSSREDTPNVLLPPSAFPVLPGESWMTYHTLIYNVNPNIDKKINK